MITAADLFCGAGGMSEGLAQAARHKNIALHLTAINHWDVAVATHTVNHPAARHYCASLDSLNPRDLYKEGELDLLLASPECTHHSNARGGKPINDQSRATAWCIVRWADALRPKMIQVENVPEFLTWGAIDAKGKPMKSKKGATFMAWAEADGTRYRVFCASLADVFENRAELWPWRDDLFRLIVATPHLDWLLLTKRPENAHSMMLDALAVDGKNHELPLPNVWIGTSVENQEQADKRIHELLKIPAKVRFLSMEPLLGPVDLEWLRCEFHDLDFAEWSDFEKTEICTECAADGGHGWMTMTSNLEGIDWVIVGGESGHNARPMHPGWARSLRDQCNAAGVPFLFKQWGEYGPIFEPPYPVIKCGSGRDSAVIGLRKIGKHAAGRVLDHQTWDEIPEPGAGR